MKLKPVLLAVAALMALPAIAENLTVVNFGGANGAAQKVAYIEPFEKSGTKVTAVEYNGEQAKIKAMVEAKNVTWDVVEVESPDLSRGCDEGLFETIDWSKVGNKADFQKAAVHECGVGTFVWSTVMAYDGDKLKTAPTTWADFWDVKKFPGKRGLRKGARYNLEFALMADGVPADAAKLYPIDADRAFKKLDQIKPVVVTPGAPVAKDAAIYVAGHRGLVGSALMRRLEADGYTNLLTVTRHEVDLRDQSQVHGWFEENRPEYVYLVAGTVGGIYANSTRPAEFLYDNLMIHGTVVHAAHMVGTKKLLYLGSSCIYPREAQQPITEDQLLTGPLEPTNEGYALAKIAGIKLCLERRAASWQYWQSMPFLPACKACENLIGCSGAYPC